MKAPEAVTRSRKVQRVDTRSRHPEPLPGAVTRWPESTANPEAAVIETKSPFFGVILVGIIRGNFLKIPSNSLYFPNGLILFSANDSPLKMLIPSVVLNEFT